MNKNTINNTTVEFDQTKVSEFLQSLTFPVAIVDFETFRFNSNKKRSKMPFENDFREKIFAASIVVIAKPEVLSLQNLNGKKFKLFSKAELPKNRDFPTFESFLNYQLGFYRFLAQKILKYQVKSLVFLGARTEILLFKNYLTFINDEPKLKNKISYFFQKNQIFDLYDLWNHDEGINLPELKAKSFSPTVEYGATKKTISLIKQNPEYNHLLNQDTPLSNHEIGRIIDYYFKRGTSLLPEFLIYTKNHNENDVLIGMMILSILFRLETK